MLFRSRDGVTVMRGRWREGAGKGECETERSVDVDSWHRPVCNCMHLGVFIQLRGNTHRCSGLESRGVSVWSRQPFHHLSLH